MKKCLILLTAGFPFGSGEPFLESEINYLSESFDKVIIFAQDIDSSVSTARTVPDAVDFHNISVRSKKAGRVSDILKGALRAVTPSQIYKDDRDAVGHSVEKRIFLEYFDARSERHFNEILPLLDKYDFSAFDSIVIYSYWFFATAKTGVLLKNYLRDYNVKLISRGHRYDIYEYVNSLKYLPERKLLLGETDRLFTCSRNGADYLRSKYPDFSDKIGFSYLGTPDRGLNPNGDGRVFRILTCSRAVPVKQLDRLIHALALIGDCNIDISWTHIGDGSELNKLMKLAEKELSFVKYEFLGALPNCNVLDYYKTHHIDLFVNVSSNEGLPVSIMETASFGIPTLATNVGGTGEIVIDGVSGFLTGSDFTDSSLAEIIKKAVSMPPDEYGKLRDGARLNWEKNFRADMNYRAFSIIIGNL